MAQRIQYCNPGCLMLLLMFVLATFVAALPTSLVNAYWYRSGAGLLLHPLLTVLIAVGFVRLYQRSTRPIAPTVLDVASRRRTSSGSARTASA